MIVFTAVLLALGGLLYALVVRARDLPPPEPVSPASLLEQKRDAVYESLRDLQFEYRVGKLSDDDYQRSKLHLRQELAAVTAEIEKTTGQVKPPAPAAALPAPGPEAAAVCPNCAARFPRPMKFCGECGSPMAGGAA